MPDPPVVALAVKSPDVDTSPGVPSLTDHVGASVTALPYASAPLAVNCSAPPDATEAFSGDSCSFASGPAVMVSACCAPMRTGAAALTVGVPATVSR